MFKVRGALVLTTLLLLGSPAWASGLRTALAKPVSAVGAVARKAGFSGECKRRRRAAARRGTVAGAVLGGVVGAATVATPVGVGVGAVAGHQLAKRGKHC